MRTLLFTMISQAYKEVGDITLPNMTAYAAKHGYAFEVGLYHTDPNRLSDYGDRGKIAFLEKRWNDYDVAMFLDLDALIMNSDIRIEDVLYDRPFLWSYHVDGPCSGFWIAQTKPEVHLTLAAVANRAPLMGNIRTREDFGPPHKIVLEMEPHGQSDQETMRELMRLPPFSDVLKHCVSGKEAGHCFSYPDIGWPEHFNYMGNYEPGDWILTFPAIPLERRVALLQQAALKAH